MSGGKGRRKREEGSEWREEEGEGGRGSEGKGRREREGGREEGSGGRGREGEGGREWRVREWRNTKEGTVMCRNKGEKQRNLHSG